MSELTFGMRITYEGQAANAGLEATRGKVEQVTRSTSKMASEYSGLNQAVKQHTTAVSETERGVNRLLDRYDPLGARLRQLQADFKALDRAAASGKIAGRDDARVDAVYVRLQKEINAASAATVGFGVASKNTALSARQLRMATQQLPMQFTDIFTSLAAGQTPMMVMLQQGGQIKDMFGGVGNAAKAMGRYMLSMVNPITLVTAALAAGAYAWYKYENVAVEGAEKTMDALEKAISGGRRLATMNKEALDGAIADAEVSIEAKKALIDALRWDPKRRFKLKDSIAQEAEYNKEIKLTTSRIIEMKSARDRLGDGADKLREQSSFARREALAKEIALLETDNARQQAGSREYLANLSAIQDKKKQLADMDKKAAGGRDPHAAAVASLQAEQFRKKMDLMGVSAEQVKVYELALAGANKEELIAAQAAADAIAPLNAELEARKKLQKQAKADAAAQIKVSRASVAARDESAKAIDKARTASAEYVNQLQFENSLLGKNALDVQQLTEKRRIDLALEKELLALRNNDKFKSRDTNPEVDAAYQLAVKGAQDAAEAAEAGAEVEIDARWRVTRAWETGTDAAMRAYLLDVGNAAKQSERLFGNAFKNMDDALVRFVRHGKLDFSSLADSMINDMIRIEMQRNITAPLVDMMQSSGFGGWLGGLLGFNGSSSPTGMAGFSAAQLAGPVMSANGNVFSGAGIGAYSNTIVDTPTLFPFARGIGLMGEKPGSPGEAIMPLTRMSGGDLGVKTSGGGANVTVNIINAPAGTQVQQRPDGNGGMTLDVIIEQIEGGIARNVSRGTGALNGALTQTFGLNRTAGALR